MCDATLKFGLVHQVGCNIKFSLVGCSVTRWGGVRDAHH